jgi:hypothetical protein
MDQLSKQENMLLLHKQSLVIIGSGNRYIRPLKQPSFEPGSNIIFLPIPHDRLVNTDCIVKYHTFSVIHLDPVRELIAPARSGTRLLCLVLCVSTVG